MSEKSHWLLIGLVLGAVFLSIGGLPASVNVSGPSILVFLALAWIAVRFAGDLRTATTKARPYLTQVAAALEDEPPIKRGARCNDCDTRLPVSAVYCIGCGKRLPVMGKTEALR